jgi:hypothetical protein
MSGLEQLRVASNVLDPKLPHYPLHVIGVKSTPIRAAKLTHAQNSRKWVAGVWRKGRIGRLMDDPLRRNMELISPDKTAFHDHPALRSNFPVQAE